MRWLEDRNFFELSNVICLHLLWIESEDFRITARIDVNFSEPPCATTYERKWGETLMENTIMYYVSPAISHHVKYIRRLHLFAGLA